MKTYIKTFFILFLLSAMFTNPLGAATITVDSSTTYQTITGWEATSQAGQA